jgi:hypothetical protein
MNFLKRKDAKALSSIAKNTAAAWTFSFALTFASSRLCV